MKKSAFIFLSLFSALQTLGQYDEVIDPKKKFPLSVLIPETSVRSPRISPDGSMVLFVQETGSESHISISEVTSTDAQKPLLTFPSESIDQLEWINSSGIVFTLDENHDGIFDIYTTDLESIDKATKVSNGNDARITHLFKGEQSSFSFWQWNPASGSYDLIVHTPAKSYTATVMANLPVDATHLTCDASFQKALYSRESKQGQELYYRDASTSDYTLILSSTENDRVLPICFSAKGESFYALSNVARDQFSLVEINPSTGKEIKLISRNTITDVKSVGFSHKTGAPIFSNSLFKGTLKNEGFDEKYTTLFSTANPIIGSNFEIESFDASESLFVLRKISITSPYSYVVYDINSKAIFEPFGRESLSLPKEVLSKTSNFQFTLADGSQVNAQINIPKGSTGSPLVVILNQYNSDFSDNQLNAEVQNLCQQNRAVLRIAIPGTIGYGKSYLNTTSLLNPNWFYEVIDAASARLKVEFKFIPQSINLFAGSFSTPFVVQELNSKNKTFQRIALQNIPLWSDQNGVCYRANQWSTYGQTHITDAVVSNIMKAPISGALINEPMIVVNMHDTQTRELLPQVKNFTQLKTAYLTRVLRLSNEQNKLDFIMK